MHRQMNIYDLNYAELQALLKDWGEPAYRTRQIWEWLYVHLAASFDEMTNLPLSLREKLAAHATMEWPVLASQVSTDGRTRKDLLQLQDGETVETVLMRYQSRRTACISTQVGCAVGCTFCATGQAGFQRNLSTGEIVLQAIHFARLLYQEDDRLSNVVLMGMGEPLLNYEATVAAIHRLIDPDGFRLGQRHITLSTVGIVPAIDRLAEEELQITLAISLHAATDALRNVLVPINQRYRLDDLFAACYRYNQQTGRRISFEWALIAGVNDTEQQARALAARLVGLHSHVNLIPLNPTPAYQGQPPDPEAVAAFTDYLDQLHVPYTVRVRRGIEIQAGCGQLRQRTTG